MTDAELIKWLETNSEELDGEDLQFLLTFKDNAIGCGSSIEELDFYDISEIDYFGFTTRQAMDMVVKGFYDPQAPYFRFDEWDDFESMTDESVETEFENYRDEIIGAFIEFIGTHDFKMEEFQEAVSRLLPPMVF